MSESGLIEKLTLASGNPLFVEPASDAVKKWKFEPGTRDGRPVRASTKDTVRFRH